MRKVISKFTLGDMCAFYLTDEYGRVELTLTPASMAGNICLDKAGRCDSLIQFMVDGDATSTGYSQGHTERNSESVDKLKYAGQKCVTVDSVTTVETYFDYEGKLGLTHRLTCKEGARAASVCTLVQNNAEEDITLTSISSFSISMLTPFDEGETFHRMNYYRIRSKWSTEGRVECGSIEDMQLEPNWARHGVSVEKYGQIGSLPVRKFFPFGAVGDSEAGVIWAAQLACGGSWQMEYYRKDESLAISGGLPDYEYGHFLKTLSPGGLFVTPEAYITVNNGEFDSTCQRLIDCHEVSDLFRGEGRRLPYVFNEYCTTWGNPSHDNIANIVDTIKDKDFDYFVIDAGWYSAGDIGWEHNMGDWEIAENLFPEGLTVTLDAIRGAGMKPGIWFEPEVVGKLSKVLSEEAHILKRRGKLIMSGERYFFDMRDEWTRQYLREHVIKFLADYGLDYVKTDYNESIGVGCDGAESPGSALWDVIESSRDFYREIHEAVPGICVELCSSGGHRLEPSFLNITDMASFSDAHETPEIPVIAANLHRIMRPEKSQIWCVVRENDPDKRLCYSLVSAMLGVMCISGDVLHLSARQWELIDGAAAFYRRLDEIIKDGTTEYFGTVQRNYRALEGYQAVVRKLERDGSAYVVINTFDKDQDVEIDLADEYEMAEVFEEYKHDITINNGVINVHVKDDYEGIAILLRKTGA